MHNFRKPIQTSTQIGALICSNRPRRFLTNRTDSTHEELELYVSQSHMHSKGLFESINNHRIHYIRTGHGDHNLLLCPAPLGSAMTDYSIFLEKLDKTKFTAISWDPPGQGASIPPLNRSWLNPNRLDEDAQLGLTLMRTLKLCPFSILAWSDAIVTALLMVLNHADEDEVRKLILWALEGAIPCNTKQHLANNQSKQNWLNQYENINQWPTTCRSPLEATYGTDYLQKQWSSYMEAIRLNKIQQSIPMDHWKLQMQSRWNLENSQPRIMLMRSPGWNNSENWLTYLLASSNQTRVINWLNQNGNDRASQTGDRQPCWGPHKVDSEKFVLLVEQFLSDDGSLHF